MRSLFAGGLGVAWAGVVALVVFGGVRYFRQALRTGQMLGRGVVYDRRSGPVWFWGYFMQAAAVWLFAIAILAAFGVASVWLVVVGVR